jgi:hypothetical protein
MTLLAAVATEDETSTVSSVTHDGTSLVSVASHSLGAHEIEHAWTCHRARGAARTCGETRLWDFRAIDPARSLPRGWLLRAQDSGHRWRSTWLVWVSLAPGGLEAASLEVAGTGGQGEGCPHADSYCVFTEGTWIPYQILAPQCVRLERATLWSATRIRKQSRWVGEKVWKAPIDHDPPPGTYRPSGGSWVPAACAAP